jgi:hypothetical protein
MLSLNRTQPPPPSLNLNNLRHLVAKAVEKGWVREVWHSERERAYRNISMEDVLYGLERPDWTLAAPPDYDARHKNWEYLIKTVDIEGVELDLKIAPNPADGTIIVITKF